MSNPAPSMLAKLQRLTAQRRCLVSERAAIIQEATGCTYAEADRLALEFEGSAQAALPGVGVPP